MLLVLFFFCCCAGQEVPIGGGGQFFGVGDASRGRGGGGAGIGGQRGNRRDRREKWAWGVLQVAVGFFMDWWRLRGGREAALALAF